MFNTANTLNQLINRENLSPDTMAAFMTELMSGQLAAPAAAALLTGLRAKGETLDEIVAAARVMRDFSTASRSLTTAALSTSSAQAAMV